MQPMGHHLGPVAESTCQLIPISPFRPVIAATVLVTENNLQWIKCNKMLKSQCKKLNKKRKGQVRRLGLTQNCQARSRTGTGLRSIDRWLRDRGLARGVTEEEGCGWFKFFAGTTARKGWKPKALMTRYLGKVHESFTAIGQKGPQGFKQNKPETS